MHFLAKPLHIALPPSYLATLPLNARANGLELTAIPSIRHAADSAPRMNALFCRELATADIRASDSIVLLFKVLK